MSPYMKYLPLLACKQNGAGFGGGEKDAWVICCQDSKMIKTNKLLRLKTKNGRLLDVVREHYLRKDVPCHSEICTGCEQGRKCFLKVKAVWVKIFRSYVV